MPDNNSNHCSTNCKLALSRLLTAEMLCFFKNPVERIPGSWSLCPHIPALCNGAVFISAASLTLSANFHKLRFFTSLISLHGSLSATQKSHIKPLFLLQLNRLSLSLQPALFSSTCRIFNAYLCRVANSVGIAQNPLTAVLSYYLWQSSHCHTDQ